jgi:hypothetical protein
MPVTKAEAQEYQENIVEYQCTSMLMIHIQGEVLIWVRPYTIRKRPEKVTLRQ